jgi:hypothetical protein
MKYLRNEGTMTTHSPEDQNTPVAKQTTDTPAQESILSPPSAHDVRDELTDMVIRDLLGPAGGPEEELDQREDRVRERYLVGALAPRAVSVEAEELDQLGSAEPDDMEVGMTDILAPTRNTMLPSSIGMSFVVGPEASTILIETEWGRYSRVQSDIQKRKDGSPATAWKRHQVNGQPQLITLKNGLIGPVTPHPDQPLVVVHGRMRKTQDGWIVTIFLVNKQEEQKKLKDEPWVFQPKIAVLDPDRRPIFIQRRSVSIDLGKMDSLTREEIETLDMIYRHRLEFAVGHGVSIHVTLPEADAEKATLIETTFIPLAEVAQQVPPTSEDDGFASLAGLVRDMKALAEMPKADLVANLRIMERAYGDWIAREAAKLADSAEGLERCQEAVGKTMERCRRMQERIQEGISVLESDSRAEEAFRFANRAMWLQRIRSTYARRVRKKEMAPEEGLGGIDVPDNRSWRLFQIAFILLNLPSVTNLHHPDRSHETDAVADLLWFATAGGKTEAYLGLTAYVLALRRLQGDIEGRPGDHGVAVLMRYTLRLLTLQQFQRAAALLCACEAIRREDTGKWGTVPFRLGLWVGNKTTPNTLKQAAEALRQTRLGGPPSAFGSPYQMTSCPWCGKEIRQNNVHVYEPPGDIARSVMYCGDTLGQCEFSEARAPREGLPVMVVDEEIYRRPPSLLIATVDKFAQMPWKGAVQMLFGKVNAFCPRHGFLSPEIDDAQSHPARGTLPRTANIPHGPLRPPDLIIQDELHLISGPLGSMVGLYETAVDELCTWEVDGRRVRPKVVASTATIRRAHDQVRKLFLRRLEVFPPNGTSIENNFFSLQKPPGANFPGRRYLGICAFGRRYPAVLIRVYVAFMAAAQALYDKYDRVADPWMTAVGYFNSIRELAGQRRLMEDDIRTRLRAADHRGLARRLIRLGGVEELTSRKAGTDIPRILDRLEAVFDKTQEAQRQADRKAGKPIQTRYPYDAVLATNMISVGVDIDRLGLMIVAGQPKNTSEYIQATSRVGRSAQGPGLVCTVYNWARPRDISHYETFEHYHDTFYKHVEALSVTPFAPRALDRGLSGVLVSLMRLWDDRLNANQKAGELQDMEPLMSEVFQRIIHRAEMATGNVLTGTIVRQMLNERRDFWLSRVHNATDHRLGYNKEGQGIVELLKMPEPTQWQLFTCLNSLRDVEGTVKLIYNPNPAGLRTGTDPQW